MTTKLAAEADAAALFSMTGAAAGVRAETPTGAIASPTPAPMGLVAGASAEGADTGAILGGEGGEAMGALVGGGGRGAIFGGAGAGARLGDAAGACAVAATAKRARNATRTAARRAIYVTSE